MTKLCPRGKAAAKRKFRVYPSAYANAYASKICAGKIKDPSGTKRKDWGPKKAKVGMAVTAGAKSALGRLEKSGMTIKKKLYGGLLTTGIKAAVKGLKKSGATITKLQRKHMAKDIKDHRSRGFKTGYRTRDMSDTTKRKHRIAAKDDMRAGIKMRTRDKKDLTLIRLSSDKADKSKAQYVIDMLREANQRYKKLN